MKPAMILTGILMANVCGSALLCSAHVVAASSATRPSPRPAPEPQTYRVTVSPAAVPDEALKYWNVLTQRYPDHKVTSKAKPNIEKLVGKAGKPHQAPASRVARRTSSR